MDKIEELSEKFDKHDEKDDTRFAELKEDIQDIRRFANRLEPILFPEEGSGNKPPLDILAAHERFKQRVNGAFWIVGIAFTTLCTLIMLFIHK